MRLRLWIAVAAGVCIAGLPLAAWAGAAPEEAFSVLQKRGYTSIEIAPDESPGYQAHACKGGTRFAITLDRESNIIDVDPRGACGGQQEKYAAAPPPEAETPGGFKGEGYGGPAIAHARWFEELSRRGYYDIRVIDSDDDEIEVLACRDGRLYEIEIEGNGRIDDIDRKGSCGPRRHAGRDGVNIEAPFTGVHVGRDGVRIRAPFVDLRIPR